MKQLHRQDLFAWSTFDEERNIDFNSVCWVRKGGNVLIDPLPMSDHDRAHLDALGGADFIVVTNSDHVRATSELQAALGAKVVAPAAELSIDADRYVGDGELIVDGLLARVLDGSKTPGELALLHEDTTLITGDLIRAHRGGSLMLLPDPKLTDKLAAIDSVRRLLEHERIDTVLVGDGWHRFGGGHGALAALVP